MAIFPEKEPKQKPVEHVAEEISPLEIEKGEFIKPVPTQFTAQVTDDNGQPLIETPETKKVEVTIPATSEEDLKVESKGKVDDSQTWNANFLIRAILKAIHFGKKVLFKNANT